MSDWKIRFGTAGTSDSFAAQGYKSSLDVPEYTAKMGLNAFEYQCGRGVRLGLDKAAKMAALAGPKDILFSVHAPYYISMSSLEEDKRLNSIQYLLQSAAVCRALGGRRIIFHSGSCGKQSREAALEKALDTMRRAVEALDEAGFADMTLCPETMGKIGQLGTLDEVLALCAVKLMILPALFLPLAVHLGFTDEKLVALLVMLGSITTPACYVMAKQMGHEGVLTGSVCVTTTLFSAFSLTFWLFVLRSLGYIL